MRLFRCRFAGPLVALAALATAQDRKPAVVTIDEAEQNERVTPVVKAVRRARDSVASIYLVNEDRPLRTPQGVVAEGQGSGVVLDQNGLLITNWHVVALAEARQGYRIEVRFRDGRNFAASLLSTSPPDDLALLQLDLPSGTTVKPVALGDSGGLEVGESVLAIGNPQGHANTVTVGVLSATDRSITVRTPDGVVRQYSGLLQTDAAINQGNSGGALLDITGKLIGINNAMAGNAQNIGFAIPVDKVVRVFREKLLSSESIAQVWFGMRVVDEDGAPVVRDVDPHGPARAAGLAPGDRLLRASDQQVGSALDWARSVLEARPGQEFPLQVERGGRRLRFTPVPLPVATHELLKRIGVVVDDVTAADNRALLQQATREFYAGTGYRRYPLLPTVLRVRSVQEDSPAAEHGLRPGDVLFGLRNTTPFYVQHVMLQSSGDLAEKLRDLSGRRVGTLVLRGDQVLEGELSVR
jgi:S1-C subfamily serine protease